ncbi:hypothetical protein BC830DRAFT_1084581 [Chytriomyces sp. MP71]|nr:hypothetical protein BC830DRAFT_1084581 [Chytriomyces sp. MP71]
MMRELDSSLIHLVSSGRQPDDSDRMPPRVCDLLDCTLSGYMNAAVIKTGASDEEIVLQRFVVLIGSELHLFPTSEPFASSLDNLELLPVGAVGIERITWKPHTFSVVRGAKAFILAAESEPAMEIWMEAIRVPYEKHLRFDTRREKMELLKMQIADVERQRRKLLNGSRKNSSASEILPVAAKITTIGSIRRHSEEDRPFSFASTVFHTKSSSGDSNTHLRALQELQNMPLPAPASSNSRTETASATVKIENLTQPSSEFQMRGFNAFATEIEHPRSRSATPKPSTPTPGVIPTPPGSFKDATTSRNALPSSSTEPVPSKAISTEARQSPIPQSPSPIPGSKASSPHGSPYGSPTAKGVVQTILHGASQLRMDDGGALKIARAPASISTGIRVGDAESAGRVASNPSNAFPEAFGINCFVLDVKKN